MQQLSRRLKKIAGYIEDGARLADIGSDHAYLPIYLCQQGKIDAAIAGEVVEGPFQHALEEVKKRGLEDKIEVRLGDGLSVIEDGDDIDTVTIAGMGGRLIARILEEGKEAIKIRPGMIFILQPNNEEEVLRRFALQAGFCILDEYILEENEHYYEIFYLKNEGQGETWTDRELYLGKSLQSSNPSVFRSKYEDEKDKFKTIISNLEQSQSDQDQKIAYYEERIRWIEEALS